MDSELVNTVDVNPSEEGLVLMAAMHIETTTITESVDRHGNIIQSIERRIEIMEAVRQRRLAVSSDEAASTIAGSETESVGPSERRLTASSSTDLPALCYPDFDGSETEVASEFTDAVSSSDIELYGDQELLAIEYKPLSSGEKFDDQQFIVSLLVGIKVIRCQMVNRAGAIVSSVQRRLVVSHPCPGSSEIDPEVLWSTVKAVMTIVVRNAFVTFKQVKCLAISTHTGSFITWNKFTKKPYHNFIMSDDLRANDIVDELNSSWKLWAVNASSKFLHFFTRRDEHLSGSKIKMSNREVPARLMWVLSDPSIQSDALNGGVSFGTLDTWLIYKLTNGSTFVAEVSNASATGLFNPIEMTWSSVILKLTGIPADILPPVVDTAGSHFGSVSPDIFGQEIPIRCVMSEQSANMFALGCFEEGSAKLTLGIGSVLNINTGSSIRLASNGVLGIYPTVAWKWGSELRYFVEQAANDTGALFEWSIKLGLCKNRRESFEVLKSVSDTGGVYFVPAFCGLEAPINDPSASTAFIGIGPFTKKAHLLRAIWESVAFRISQLIGIVKNDLIPLNAPIRVDGEESLNNFLLQFLSDLTDLSLERISPFETSALGAAFFAGRVSGSWNLKDQARMTKVDETFEPRVSQEEKFKRWLSAVERFEKWEPDTADDK